MNREETITRAHGWITAWVDDELVMMSADSRFYLSLSGSGGRIWELLEKPHTLMDLCEALAVTYAVKPADVRDEVCAFLEKLRLQNAIQFHPVPVE